MANHEFSTEHYEAKGVENQMKAALSVSIFVLATIAIVIFGSMESLRPVFTVGTEKVSMQMSHIIEVLMLTSYYLQKQMVSRPHRVAFFPQVCKRW